ncbi:MAG: MBL fold metallo-hydrolase [Thermoguttaceae bacterium]|nr:MBL fold metallo-hydrolase [Thermoguttaceae bacterium]
MKKALTWLGHNCWLFEAGQTKLLIDPFLATRTAPVKPEQVQADYVLVSHGHGDHCADALSIAKRCHSTLVAIAEVGQWFGAKGIEKIEGMNIGGAVPFTCQDGNATKQGLIMMVPALHSSTMPDGASGGQPCGFVVSVPKSQNRIAATKDDPILPMNELLADAFSIYFACDTGFFVGMSWIGGLGIDVAVLPIGDRYTMGPAVSLDAARALHAGVVIPSHYGTWPMIDQDASRWAQAIGKYTDARAMVLKPGERTSLD